MKGRSFFSRFAFFGLRFVALGSVVSFAAQGVNTPVCDNSPDAYDVIVAGGRPGGNWCCLYVEPKQDVAILLDRIGLTLPAQPPPKISGDLAETAKSEV